MTTTITITRVKAVRCDYLFALPWPAKGGKAAPRHSRCKNRTRRPDGRCHIHNHTP